MAVFGTVARCFHSGTSRKIVRGLLYPDAMRERTPRAPQKTSYHKTNPYDDPKFASHVLYLSANSFADGFVPFNANDTSSCVTRFAPIKF